MAKPDRTPKLPTAAQRRPDLVHESRCVVCGYLLGTVDLNDSSHFRDEVRRGVRGPLDRHKLARVHREARRIFASEGCPCGAHMEYEHDDGALLGVRPVDKSRPIVDRLRRVGNRLLVEGRFLGGATLSVRRGNGPDGKPRAPWACDLPLRGAAREVDGLPVLPNAGDTIVVDLTNHNGTHGVTLTVG